MRNPALTRVMAIVLVILCLTMAAAGVLGLQSAEKDRKNTLYDMERLNARIEDYEAICILLEGTQSYAEQKEELDLLQKEHDHESSVHRSDLSMFTATEYGLNMGLDAIREAEAQFASYKAMFEQGIAAFQNGIGPVNTLMGQLWTLYNAAMPVLGNANAHLSAARSITADLDGGEVTYGQVVAAYDELLRMADESVELVNTLHELEPTLDALAEFDPSSLTGLADAMGQIPDSFSSFGDFSLDAYVNNGVPVDFDLNQIAAMKETYNQYWAQIKQALAVEDEVSRQAEAALESATGLSFADLRANAQSARNELAQHGDEPIDPLASDVIVAAYRLSREQILSGLDQAGAGLDTVNGYASQASGFLTTVQGQLDSLNALMEQARAMIAAAEQALYDARALIWQQQGLQREKEAELWDRKEDLEEEAGELQQLSDAADAQKSLEDQRRTLRAGLMNRNEIKARYDEGEDLIAAARAFTGESTSAAEKEYASRRLACLLMLFGAFFGLLDLPAAFEATKNRLMLILPLLHCLVCAALAEWILWNMGRGYSYSCIVVMAAVLLQLLISRPKKKEKKKNAVPA